MIGIAQRTELLKCFSHITAQSDESSLVLDEIQGLSGINQMFSVSLLDQPCIDVRVSLTGLWLPEVLIWTPLPQKLTLFFVTQLLVHMLAPVSKSHNHFFSACYCSFSYQPQQAGRHG